MSEKKEMLQLWVGFISNSNRMQMVICDIKLKFQFSSMFMA